MSNTSSGSTIQPVSAVLLDVDGTLVDSNDAQAQAWKQALQRHGHHVPYDRLRSLIGKGGDKLLAEVIGIDDESQEGKLIADERRRIFTADFLPDLRATPGARALLERFRQDGLQLIVATSASSDDLTDLLKQAGLEGLIPQSATSSDTEATKPEPHIVKAALQKAEVSAARAIMLGDTPHDVEAARRAGVRTVALRCGGWWADSAFSGAIRIYDDPADLLDRLASSPFGRHESRLESI